MCIESILVSIGQAVQGVLTQMCHVHFMKTALLNYYYYFSLMFRTHNVLCSQRRNGFFSSGNINKGEL